MDLKKPVSTIEISNDLSLVQRMAYAVILKHYYTAKPNDAGLRSINVKELCEAMGYEKKDFFYLDEQLETLQTTTIKWLGDKAGEFVRVSFFSYTAMRDGVLYYRYDPFLERHIQNKKSIYNLLDTGAMRMLKKKHAIALYELCAGYRPNTKTGFHYGTPPYGVDELKEMLTGERGKYEDFKEFSRFIIKPAIKEINDKTDIRIEAEYKRTARSVSSIKFHVSNNVSYDAREITRPALSGGKALAFNSDKISASKSSDNTFSDAYELWQDLE
jgi:plasmid replication initiation protein